MIDTLIMWNPSPPESGEDVEELTSWCSLCGEGENHKDIELCKECFDYLMNEILT